MGMDRRRISGGGYVPLRDAINQLFEGSVITPQTMGNQGTFPWADMHVTDEDVIVEMAVPGARPDDINISVTGDTVTVSGEIKREQRGTKAQTLYEEVWKGRFQRSFTVPIAVNPDRAEARFEHGILTLRLPKSEATKPRKIQVTSGSSQSGQNQVSSDSETLETEKVRVSSDGQ